MKIKEKIKNYCKENKTELAVCGLISACTIGGYLLGFRDGFDKGFRVGTYNGVSMFETATDDTLKCIPEMKKFFATVL